jgi:hypothetical protein
MEFRLKETTGPSGVSCFSKATTTLAIEFDYFPSGKPNYGQAFSPAVSLNTTSQFYQFILKREGWMSFFA